MKNRSSCRIYERSELKSLNVFNVFMVGRERNNNDIVPKLLTHHPATIYEEDDNNVLIYLTL